MSKKQEQKPTTSELAVLQVLWENGPSSVREVNDRLSQAKTVGYTTTLKIMQIMHEKGFLDRSTEGKKHIYFALVEENLVQKSMLDKLLKGTFKGSAYKLVMEALGNYRASKEELDDIKKLIDKLEGGQK